MSGSGMPLLTGLSTSEDNTQLLQAAAADGGFTLPQGVFPYSRAINPPIACTIQGMNSYRSVLRQMTPGQAGIAVRDGQRLTLAGVGITGPGAISKGSAAGISLTRQRNADTFGLEFDDVTIQQFSGNGIDAPAANVIVSAFSRVICESLGGFGFNLTGEAGGSAGTSVSMVACYANAIKKAGYRLMRMCYGSLNGGACDASGAGLCVQACEGISLNGCGAEGVLATGTDAYSDGTNFHVDNCDGIDFGGACWVYANSHLVLHVSGNSTNIKVGRIGENSPLLQARANWLVDSGSQLA